LRAGKKKRFSPFHASEKRGTLQSRVEWCFSPFREIEAMEGNLRITVSVADKPLVFSLCRKAEQLGTLPVDHWWMPTTALYAQRARSNQAAGNFAAVTAGFWALCGREGTQHDPEVQQSYLLARLVPFTRNQGSRRIFADACLGPPRRRSRSPRQDLVEELEPLLQASRTRRMSRLDFQRKTGDVLGPPALAQEAVNTYQALCQELFAPAQQRLLADEAGAVAQTLACWQRWMRSIGRRRGREQEKQVLDVLSYEARASLHRCYSAVWEMPLLPHLRARYQLSDASVRFLRLWHLDQAEESNLGEQALFHLFHGHIFGLHPAGALLLQTPTGREALGHWIADPTAAHWGSLLHAIYLATHVYLGRREQAALERRKQPVLAGNSDLLEQASGSRRPRKSRPRSRAD
jgi:hypothetical protein